MVPDWAIPGRAVFDRALPAHLDECLASLFIVLDLDSVLAGSDRAGRSERGSRRPVLPAVDDQDVIQPDAHPVVDPGCESVVTC
jgi:hypothetical protein